MASASELLRTGWQLHQAGQIDPAMECYRQVLSFAPKNADALVYLGIAHFDRREFNESVESYRAALNVRSRFPVAWNNLGNSLRMLGEVDQAEECFSKSLNQKPDYLSALKNRGTLWIWTGEIERGLRWYQRGLDVDPNEAELHRNLGVINLLLGNYEIGWPEYRWRWRMPGMQRPPFHAALWQGEPLDGKQILLYGEQGQGDAIQFVRTASLLHQRGAHVVLRCSQRLLPLFTSAKGVDRFSLEGAPPPAVDFQASMIDVVDVLFGLTGQLQCGAECFVDHSGYLTVSSELISYWKDWLGENTTKRRIGINWQGNPDHDADIYRSMPLESLRPLTRLSGVDLINLQFGDGSEQLDHCDFADSILRLPDDVDTDGGAFTDTTAILHNLDHVITTDTAIAHLAGAVGTDVTLMLGKVPDRRWLLSGDTTPWYPTMNLVRQTEIGDWVSVVQSVVKHVG